MLINAHYLPSDEVIEADLCIVGAGPAGITVARELDGKNFRVCLLESGGLEQSQDIQALGSSQSETIGNIGYPPAETMRRRQFGGTANAWGIAMNGTPMGVRYVPLEEIDFEKREWVPNSGWPFRKSHLDPYYERAQHVCKIGPYHYSVADWQDEKTPPLDLGEQIKTRMFQVGSREVFTHDYLNEFKQSANITVYFNATAVELETDEVAKTVRRVRVANLQGKQFWVTAKLVILAQGAIDNARLLLLSDQTQNVGLGNQYDVVGRYLMDHPVVRSGTLIPNSRKLFNEMALYDLRQVRNTFVIGQMSLSEEVLRREQLLHLTTSFFPLHPIYQLNLRRWLFPQGRRYQSPAVEAGITVKRAIRQKTLPKDFFKHLWTMLSGLDDLVYFFGRKNSQFGEQMSGISLPIPSRYGYDTSGWSYLEDPSKQFGLFEVVHMTEQTPDPTNRITLGTARDALDCRKPQIYWQWKEIDRQSIVRTQHILAAEFARSGLGQLKLELDRGDPQPLFVGAHHCMGTTRMHDNPKQGVVDANCKVHGVSNLFIAGKSVFPTSSYANPTLTIVALSIRLADHVQEVIEQL